MDFITEFTQDVAGAAIAIAVPIATFYAYKLLGINQTATAKAAVDGAFERAAGVAIDHGIQSGDALLMNETTKSAALKKAVDYVNTTVPDSMATLGITPEIAAQRLVGTIANAVHPAVVAADAKPTFNVPVTVVDTKPKT